MHAKFEYRYFSFAIFEEKKEKNLVDFLKEMLRPNCLTTDLNNGSSTIP